VRFAEAHFAYVSVLLSSRLPQFDSIKAIASPNSAGSRLASCSQPLQAGAEHGQA
jgi:hypothetical protein